MRFEIALLFVFVALLATYLGWTAGRAKPRRRPAIMLPPNLKIIWNPYTNAWTWAQQSPVGVWQWKREATTAEINHWMVPIENPEPLNIELDPANKLKFIAAEGVAPDNVHL